MAPKKANKMSLGEFMADDKYGSWAEEMEDAPTPASSTSAGYGRQQRPTYSDNERTFSGAFGRDRPQAGYSDRPDLPLPTKPPYTAHVGNLSFDANEAEISDFFSQCSVSNVRLVRDKMEDRPKGFGYVEFESVEGLKKALELNNEQLAGRKVRISIAEPPKDRVGGMAGDERSNVDTWRRAGPLPSLDPPARERRAGRFNDGGSEAGEGNRFERRQSGFDRDREGDGKVRDLGNWERRGPLPPATPTESESGRPPRPDRRQSPATNPFDRERQPSYQGAEDKSKRDYQRPPAPERVPTAAEKDNEWRRGAKPVTPPVPAPVAVKEKSVPSSPIVPTTRPKLALAKRSENPMQTLSPTTTDAKASPFGAARPIDTDAKLKEVEEKRAAMAAEKKAQEEKFKEERRVAKAAASAEKADKLAERGQKIGKDRTDAGEVPSGGKNFEILRRGSDASNVETNNATDGKSDEIAAIEAKTSAPTNVAPDTAVSPQEAPEDDGWSTVKRGGKAVNGKA